MLAVTGLILSNIISILFLSAIGFNRLRTTSISSLTSTVSILSTALSPSVLTRLRRSPIISFSLSISSAISCIKSLYISIGAFSVASKESASTFIDVIGVLSSWDTFDTNSSLEPSMLSSLSSSTLTASPISLYSFMVCFFILAFLSPSESDKIASFISFAGLVSLYITNTSIPLKTSKSAIITAIDILFM